MTELWAAIALLLCFASGFVLWAWWRPLPIEAQQTHRNDAVVALYRSKQQELEHELSSAQLNRSDYDQRLAEMQRTLLLETSSSQSMQYKVNNSGGLVLLFVALIIPITGFITYTQLGAHSHLSQRYNMQKTRTIAANATSLSVLVAGLEEELLQQPNNPEGWYLLANTYMQGQNLTQGIAAFESALNYVQPGSGQHSALLGQYAQALFFNDEQFSQRVNQAIAATMAQDPKDVSALSLLGIQAFENERYDAAIEYWRQALPRAGDGQGKASLKAGIASAKELLNAGSDTALSLSLPVKVMLANGLSVPVSANAVLFVYAKQVEEGMPLFAAKFNPNSIPLDLSLTDAMALQPGTRLADYTSLDLVAHIALAGVPGKRPGDLFSQTMTVNVTEGKIVYLTLDQILK
ncbi:MAG: c-type cytochrome biogenesis protein CcmI [Gammaproteobacteria bacterium]|nr:c-type cytochrome biogenesis protein CcmI [Gammaproteobacteria bacterium]